MRLGAVLFLAYVAILVVCFSYPVYRMVSGLHTAYLQSAEEPLIDTANILAAIVGQAAERDRFSAEDLYRVFLDARGRNVAAQIYETRKDKVDLSVYVTDAKGIVLFDSDNRANIGQDYSHWNDVVRTLRGEYGARVRRDRNSPNGTAALYVAAPVKVSGRIAGVLTVIKQTDNIGAFVRDMMPHIRSIAAFSLVAAILLSLGVSIWVSHQAGRLTRYADDVREGRRVTLPRLATTELRKIGDAFERMREALAGQAYVERYVEALTHEIKSPISAIRGAAEILENPSLPEAQRVHFLLNIQGEVRRIQDLVDRMLKLTELESRRTLEKKEAVPVAPIVQTIVEAVAPALLQKRLHVEVSIPDDVAIGGDPLLVHLALSNLIENAIDFSPADGRIAIAAARNGDRTDITVDDEGPGMPDYALPRAFEKFYSLERPGTGKKSTGLGLNFVQEAAALHGGEVALRNLPERGFRARLSLPCA